jgi:hypothetical protein
MLGGLWRFLVYRLAGGRVLLALTIFNWLRGRFAARRTPPPPPPPASLYEAPR